MADQSGTITPVVITGVLQGSFRKLNTTNSARAVRYTENSALIPGTGYTQTLVVGSGSDAMSFEPGNTPRVRLTPFGAGASGRYYTFNVIGEKNMMGTGSGQTIVRQPLVRFWGQLNGTVCGAGTEFTSGERFSNPITILEDFTPGSGARTTNATDGANSIVFDSMNNERVVIEPVVGTGGVPTGQTGTGATSINALQTEF